MKVLKESGPNDFELMLQQLNFMRDTGQDDLLVVAAIVIEGLHDKAQDRVNASSASEMSGIQKPPLLSPLGPRDHQT